MIRVFVGLRPGVLNEDECKLTADHLEAALRGAYPDAEILVAPDNRGLRAIILSGNQRDHRLVVKMVTNLVADGTWDWREVRLGEPPVGLQAKLAMLALPPQAWRVLGELGLSGDSTMADLTAKTRAMVLETREGRTAVLDRLEAELEDIGWWLLG